MGSLYNRPQVFLGENMTLKNITCAGLLLSISLSAGCLYANVHAPRAYRSATPADVKALPQDKRVSGRSCNRSILFMAAWGDAGYAAAVKDALSEHPDSMLYDVQSDVQATSILLGIYTRVCTIVSGRVGSP